ncbi:ABC transporter permease [uncultured Tissierella sp.]|uniref:ABC transporter permease n=1 Tax=uncultured Tissierella sp. TaxID=448160 RepID=UPI00280470A3|nr:ABC transporter permease [uncultured Tissierella sp.]MDU5080496.1 ABC transporter permease [Bacillota bacterium]
MKKDSTQHILEKTVEIILTLFIVTILSFLLMRLSPVDPATAYVKRNTPIVTEEQIQEARIELGLDKPLISQYFIWTKNALHLDFGISLKNGQPVVKEIQKVLPVTLTVVLLSACIMSIGILILGSIYYFLRNSIANYFLIFICIAGISVPPFYLASVYIDIFAVRLGIMSVVGNIGLMKYLPASLCLSIVGIALYSQLLGKSIEWEMNEDYAFYARCRGLKESRILIFHALPYAVGALLPSFLQMLGLFMAGAAVVESVFSLPGLGHLIIDSVIHRDSPMIHAGVLVLALSVVLFNVMADVLQGCLRKHRKAMEVDAA